MISKEKQFYLSAYSMIEEELKKNHKISILKSESSSLPAVISGFLTRVKVQSSNNSNEDPLREIIKHITTFMVKYGIGDLWEDFCINQTFDDPSDTYTDFNKIVYIFFKSNPEALEKFIKEFSEDFCLSFGVKSKGGPIIIPKIQNKEICLMMNLENMELTDDAKKSLYVYFSEGKIKYISLDRIGQEVFSVQVNVGRGSINSRTGDYISVFRNEFGEGVYINGTSVSLIATTEDMKTLLKFKKAR